MGDYKKVCKRCLEFKWLKARGLCETCWKIARSHNFEHYPTKQRFDPALLCHCMSPIPEPLPMWDAVQCKRCGKKLL